VAFGSYFTEGSNVNTGADLSFRESWSLTFVAAIFSFSLSEPESAGVGGAFARFRTGKTGVSESTGVSPILASLGRADCGPADIAAFRLRILFNLYEPEPPGDMADLSIADSAIGVMLVVLVGVMLFERIVMEIVASAWFF